MGYTIGVFDSGVGGENVVEAIQNAIDDVKVIFQDDPDNLPYGDKSPEKLLELMRPIISSFEADSVDAIVIACNTVSTNILPELRQLTSVPIVGFEPAIKPAVVLSNSKYITVCATPGTLHSGRYRQLKEDYADSVNVYEPDCSQWASWIQKNQMADEELSKIVTKAKEHKSDVIVLGCTHYHWIEERLQELAGDDMQVIQPTNAVISQLQRVLKQL